MKDHMESVNLKELKEKTVLLSTYINTVSDETYALFGPIENLTGYLSGLFKELYMIKQPMSGEKKLSPVLSYYVDKKEIWSKKMPIFWRLTCFVLSNNFSSERTSIRLKIRDFISNLYFGIFCIQGNVDLFIGVESINSMASLLLKLAGKAKTILYFANDYHPNRYFKLMNKIFLGLDTFMTYKADYLWVMNPRINESRYERGVEKKKIAPGYVIHGGLPFFTGGPVPVNKRNKYQIIYATRAGHGGLKIAINAFIILLNEFPDSILIVTGHADKEKYLYKEYLAKQELKGKILFTGFIKERVLNEIVKMSYIGLAVWPCNIPVSATYGDPEKIRRYFHYGLPVVTTSNAFTANKVNEGAGIIADDNAFSVASAIIEIFRDEKLYSLYAGKSEELGKVYSKRNVLNDSFKDLLSKQII